MGFKWELAASGSGERAKQPGCDPRTPAPVAASPLLFQLGIIETTLRKCSSSAPLSWRLHASLTTVAHGRGLLKIESMSGAEASVGVAAGPGPVRRSIRPVHKKRVHLRVSHSACQHTA